MACHLPKGWPGPLSGDTSGNEPPTLNSLIAYQRDLEECKLRTCFFVCGDPRPLKAQLLGVALCPIWPTRRGVRRCAGRASASQRPAILPNEAGFLAGWAPNNANSVSGAGLPFVIRLECPWPVTFEKGGRGHYPVTHRGTSPPRKIGS